MRTAVLALFCVLPTLPSAPDLIPPGHKDVKHELQLAWNPADLGLRRLIAYPVRGFNGHTVIAANTPFRFSGKYGTKIYVAPHGASCPEQREQWRELPWLSADIPVREVRSVPQSHPLARVSTLIAVRTLTEDKIELEQVSEMHYDADGNVLEETMWLPLVLVAGAGLVLLFVLGRRGRVAEAAAS